MSQTNNYNFGGYNFLVNGEIGYYPYFSAEISKRINQKKATNVCVTSEGGSGKTYICMDLCRIQNKYFSIDQVVFNFSEFMREVIKAPMGMPIIFDEPSYAMGKREWYKQLNQALVKTIESFRFKVHPLFIPIINKALLDSTVRRYLLQFQIVVNDRGYGTAYRLNPSQFQDKVYQNYFCDIKYELFDNHLCGMPSCLGCKWVMHEETPCMIFRAQYERKKAQTQEERYEQTFEEATQKETDELTDDQIELKLMEFADDFVDENGKVNRNKLMVIAKRKLKINLGHNKSYALKELIEYDLEHDKKRFKNLNL